MIMSYIFADASFGHTRCIAVILMQLEERVEERWDFNYKDYSFASLLKAKTVAVINRVT